MPVLADRKAVDRGLGEANAILRRVAAEYSRLFAKLRKDTGKASDRLTTVGEDARRPAIKKLSNQDVLDRLSAFERAYESATGHSLSSEEFYARFTSGEFDDRFGLRWATFYEAAQRTQHARTAIATP